MGKRRTYDSDFKHNAVALSYESDRSVSEVALNLGISKDTLYNWRAQLSKAGTLAFPGHGKEALTVEQQELKALKKELEGVS